MLETKIYLLFAAFFVVGIGAFAAVNASIDWDTPQSDSLAVNSEANPGEELLFVQTSKTGSLSPISKSNPIWVLKLENPGEMVTFFSDRPFRDAGDVKFDVFVNGVFTRNQVAPNADLTFIDENGDLQSYGIILQKPTSSNGDISYEISFINDTYVESRILKDIRLFIDDDTTACIVYVDTPVDLTINKPMLKPEFSNKHYSTIAENIDAGNGVTQGMTQYSQDQGTAQGAGGSFDLFYDAVDYDVTFKMHSHCENSFFNNNTVKNLHTDMKGKASLLFHMKGKTISDPERSGANAGQFTINQEYHEAFWIQISSTHLEVPGYKVTLREGDDPIEVTANKYTGIPNAKTGERTMTICTYASSQCLTETITLDTSTVPTVNCDYDYTVPSLSCSETDDVFSDFPDHVHHSKHSNNSKHDDDSKNKGSGQS